MEALNSESESFDRAVRLSEGIDPFCSSSAWVMAAKTAFHPENEAVVMRDLAGYAAFFRIDSEPWGRMYLPLETSWRLASPLVGGDAPRLANAFTGFLRETEPRWETVFLPGMVEGCPLWRALIGILVPRYALYRGPDSVRPVASLEGGADAFLARRTPKFRYNLRRAAKLATEAGIDFQHYAMPMEPVEWTRLFDRIMDVEGRGWKGREGAGVNRGAMRIFYTELMARLAPRGRIRAMLAVRDGRDVGYILGGVTGNRYRGFQFSYDDDYRKLSLGNLLQLRMIERLCDEGFVWYDLGMDIDYKRRWAEGVLTTGSLLLRKRP